MAYAVYKSRRLGMLCAVVSLFMSLSFRTVDADAVSWNYKPGDFGGPENWYQSYPDCNGVMQSPININSSGVLLDPNLELFDFSDYRKTANVSMELENVGGHTAEVLYSGTPLYLTGGGLPDIYKLDQFHFHWGAVDNNGSEHTFNGVHYPMEAHFVHHQKHLDNITMAAPHPFGLAVVAVFFKIVPDDNPKYNQLLDYFVNISNASVPDTKVAIPTFAVMDLLPPSVRYDYFRYFGSLTTPPCSETVIWSILTDVVGISERQLNKFRGLFDEEHHNLVNDFRPIQKINKRSILTTHLMYKTSSTDDAMTIAGSHITTLFFAVLCLVIYVL